MNDQPTGAAAVVRTALVILAGAALAGCIGGSRFQSPQPLPATPAQPVTAEALEPVDPPPQLEEPIEAAEPQVASLPDEATALDITRDDLVGGWALSSAGETCQLFMSLTQWTGGYRASTRGCADENLSAISAWDVSGKTVTLKGEEGATVATLLATGPQSFSGASAAGRAVTVAR